MPYTILTKKFANARFILPLLADNSAYLICKPILATKLDEISRNVLAETGFDAALAARKMPAVLLENYVTGWHGLVDLGGEEIPFSVETLREICEHDPDFVAQQLERLRRIAREGKLEEEKN